MESLFRCFPHRLQLVSTHALRDTPKIRQVIKDIDAVPNMVYNFYRRSRRKLDHLIETASQMGKPVPKPKYVFFVRWLTSQADAMITVTENWPVLLQDLTTIEDDTFELELRLKDRRFLVLFHIVTDVLEHLGEYTRMLQRAEQVAVDAIYFKEDLMKYLDDLSKRKRRFRRLSAFMDSCQCDGNECASMVIFMQAETAQCDGHELAKPALYPELSLSTFIDTLVERLRSEADRYFPESDDIEHVNFLVPKKLPLPGTDLGNYGAESVTALVHHFNLGTLEQCLSEWQEVLQIAINHDPECDYRQVIPHIFWAEILDGLDGDRFQHIIRLIRMIIIIPSGTVFSERSFSVMNHIKSPSKSLLSIGHLEDRLRIALNGHEDLTTIPFSQFAGIWSATRSTPDRPLHPENAPDNNFSFRPLFLDD